MPPGFTARYKFTDHIASGGMADVFAANTSGPAGTTRRVAVKRVLRDYVDDPSFRRMFVDEVRLSVQLQHPNIVQTYDVLEIEGELYLIMELLEGTPLLHVLQQLHGKTPMPASHALYLVDQVLSGLHYAHERLDTAGEPMGIVHRDVSPQNVFLTVDGNVKLLDFGVARATEGDRETHTDSGVVKGKLNYMSPEQCRGADVDRRADIFAAGLLLYSVLTESHPFRAGTTYETMRGLIHDAAPPPSEIVPGLPTDLDELVLRALEKDPDDRFQTAQAMREAVAQVVRANHLYLHDHEFAQLVQQHLPETSENKTELPNDLVVGSLIPEVHTGKHSAADAALAETPHAIIERRMGVTVVTLRGLLNETFDPNPLLQHCNGVVLLDTYGVERISSFGMRGLLTLFEQSQHQSLYHMRMSVPMLQQVAMVKALLGGGQVLSYELPYVDPETGNVFHLGVEGSEAYEVAQSRKPPEAPCPGFPNRMGVFDDDPDAYFAFASHVAESIDPHIDAVLQGLAVESLERQVEKTIDDKGTVLWIRRPLDDAYRWRNLMRGIEGTVQIDFEDTPSWTSDGVQKFVAALVAASPDIEHFEITHAPGPLIERLANHVELWPRFSSNSTARVHAMCNGCGIPRRLTAPLGELTSIQVGSPLSSCPTCNDGTLISTEKLMPETTLLPPTEGAGAGDVIEPYTHPVGLYVLALVVAVALLGFGFVYL